MRAPGHQTFLAQRHLARLVIIALLFEGTVSLECCAQVPNALLYSFFNPSTNAQTGTMQGETVAVDGDIAVAGAPYAAVGAWSAGAAKVYNAQSGALLLTLTNPTPEVEESFGAAVAVSGTLVVIGASHDDGDSGSAYIFDLASGTPTVPVAKLRNPSPAYGDSFGAAVAISGTRVVVGAYQDSPGASLAGSAYVYDISSATPTTPINTLTNPTPRANGRFGFSVAISGVRAVVGAPVYSSAPGAAHVYDLTGPTPNLPVATVMSAQARPGDEFGFSVAISGTTVAVGSYEDAFVYTYDIASPTPTLPLTVLTNPSPASNDRFGFSVAAHGTRVVVGAYGDDASATNGGIAYIYDLAGAAAAVPTVVLNNPMPTEEDRFGYSVSIAGSRVVVSAPLDDTATFDAGSAYSYDLDNSNSTTPVATMSEPSGPPAGDNYGASVAVSGTLVVVGAPEHDLGALDAGCAYVYDLPIVESNLPTLKLLNPMPGTRDRFGSAVAASGAQVVVGAPYDSPGAQYAGSVYAYHLATESPTTPITVTNPTPASGEQFGYSVALSGSWLVAGAPYDRVGAFNAGSAYAYNLLGTTPTRPAVVITNPNPANDDGFGYSVAISGTRIAVGAYQDDVGAANAGSAYIYDLASATPHLPLLVLTNPTPAPGDNFGNAIGISGTRVAVAAFKDGFAATISGSVYVYELTNSVPHVPLATLSRGQAGERFGEAMALSKNRAVVGARWSYPDVWSPQMGATYVFDVTGTFSIATTLRYPNPGPGHNFGMSVAIEDPIVAASAPGLGTVFVFGPRPSLRMLSTGPGSAMVSWTPPNVPGFVLQHRDWLGPTNWLNAASGASNPVMVPIMSNNSRFFRVTKP